MRDLRETAKAALAAMHDALEAAYHRCYPECCGRPGMECCGQPLQAWSPDDQHIMDTLGPVEKSLRAALAADADRVSVPSDMVLGLTAVSTQPRYAGWVFVKHVDGQNWTTGAKLTPETWGMIAAVLAAIEQEKKS